MKRAHSSSWSSGDEDDSVSEQTPQTTTVRGDDLLARLAALDGRGGPAATAAPLGVQAGDVFVPLVTPVRDELKNRPHVPRNDGLLVQRDDPTHIVNQIEWDAAMQEELAAREQLLANDPMYRFLTLLAGATQSDVLDFVTEDSRRNRDEYDMQLRKLFEAERKQIDVSYADKQAQLKGVQETIDRLSENFNNTAALVETMEHLAQLCGDLGTMTGTTEEVPRGLGLLYYIQRQYEIVDAMINLGPTGVKTEAGRFRQAIVDSFNVDTEKKLFNNAVAAAFLENQVLRQLQLDADASIMFFVSKLGFYLILRNEIASPFTSISRFAIDVEDKLPLRPKPFGVNTGQPMQQTTIKLVARKRDSKMTRSIPHFLVSTLAHAVATARYVDTNMTVLWQTLAIDLADASADTNPSGLVATFWSIVRRFSGASKEAQGTFLPLPDIRRMPISLDTEMVAFTQKAENVIGDTPKRNDYPFIIFQNRNFFHHNGKESVEYIWLLANNTTRPEGATSIWERILHMQHQTQRDAIPHDALFPESVLNIRALRYWMARVHTSLTLSLSSGDQNDLSNLFGKVENHYDLIDAYLLDAISSFDIEKRLWDPSKGFFQFVDKKTVHDAFWDPNKIASLLGMTSERPFQKDELQFILVTILLAPSYLMQKVLENEKNEGTLANFLRVRSDGKNNWTYLTILIRRTSLDLWLSNGPQKLREQVQQLVNKFDGFTKLEGLDITVTLRHANRDEPQTLGDTLSKFQPFIYDAQGQFKDFFDVVQAFFFNVAGYWTPWFTGFGESTKTRLRYDGRGRNRAYDIKETRDFWCNSICCVHQGLEPLEQSKQKSNK